MEIILNALILKSVKRQDESDLAHKRKNIAQKIHFTRINPSDFRATCGVITA
jgi:hypothetical protein